MPYVYQDEYNGATDGKWVRYDGSGAMIKGWHDNKRYYYDLITGEMAKGNYTIDGQVYFFDPVTGVNQGLAAKELAEDDWRLQLARDWSGQEGDCDSWAWKYSYAITGFHEAYYYSANIYEISREELRVGDLIHYFSAYTNTPHSCIYLGENRAFHGNYSVKGVPQTTIAPWPSPGATDLHFYRSNHNSAYSVGSGD